jgi:transcriptional regulator with XRE-family HTH domain
MVEMAEGSGPLYELRMQSGMSQREFAKVLGIHQSQVSDLERGTGLIPRNLVSGLQVFGVVGEAADVFVSDLRDLMEARRVALRLRVASGLGGEA